MYVIKKINIKRFARFFGIFSALFSTIPAIFGLGSLFFALIFSGARYLGIFSFMPLLVLIIMPLFSYLLGCIFGSLFGYIYNALAERGYGIEIDIEMVQEVK